MAETASEMYVSNFRIFRVKGTVMTTVGIGDVAAVR